jgi:hypothetical protein
MPTIDQLPSASSTSPQDVLPIEQSGVTRSVSVAELLSGTQAAIELPSPSVLGRASLGPGGPESLSVGLGLAVQNASIAANGGDHAFFIQAQSFLTTDEAIINSSGTPKQLPIPALRALFSAGTNVTIDQNGVIGAVTDPGVTSELQTLTSGLASADTSITTLSALIPPGGVAGLNANGQVTAPIAGDASLGTVKAADTGTARALATRAVDVINVLDFGAVIGGADCTAAFIAAFNQLPSGGGEIFVPGGDYWISTPLVFTGKPVAFRGTGRGQTRLHFQHTGIGFDFVPNNLFSKIIVKDISFYAESTTGQTAAACRITYPSSSSFGYVTTSIDEVEIFGYPNAANGTSPFPQTFLRGIVLNNCWSTQVRNVSWFGPPAAAGTTTSAVIEVNGSIDTRIDGIQAYFGNAVVLQTGYCEGIYIHAPVVVGADYLVTQTNETQWAGYKPNQALLLGLWVANGEVNTNLGTVLLNNVTGGFFSNLDISRDSGPSTAQSFFNLTNVSNFQISQCNFVGGPSGGVSQDIAFNFNATWDSSDNVIEGCFFEDMATAILINGANGTVGLTAYGLRFSNIPNATAIIDNSGNSSGNFISFSTPVQGSAPSGIGNTKDWVWTGQTGQTLFYINNIAAATNYIRNQPAATASSPALCFDGSDGQVNGTIQTKGGNLYLNAAGGTSQSGNLASFLNTAGSTNWVVIQNAKGSNSSTISTNAGGLSMIPNGALSLSPTGGIFAPGLPTTKPSSGSSQIWNNNGVLSIA